MNSHPLLDLPGHSRRFKSWFNELPTRWPDISAAVWRLVLLLLLASGTASALWALRIFITGRWQHVFLPWNLFLAWIPFGLAAWTLHLGNRHGWRSWKPWLAAAGWLLFFPNAPYLLTDLVHLREDQDHRYWMNLIMILLFAWPGFLVGCLSLRLMHAAVVRHLGGLAGWCFAAAVCFLAGAGVYIGRFLRWNSWDLIANPAGLMFDLLGFLGHSPTHPAYRFSFLFGLLLLVGYGTLCTSAFVVAGTRTSRAGSTPENQEPFHGPGAM